MHPDQLIALLGRPASDPAVEATLTHFKIRRRPEVESDDDGSEIQVLSSQDWLKNRSAGIEFGFEEEASWLGKPQNPRPPHAMVLTQIYFYANHPGIKPYIDQLPLGIAMSDDRVRARAKLARFEPTRRSYVRDTWELPDHQVIVHYADDGAQVGWVLCCLRIPPKPHADEIVTVPTIAELIALLGRRMDDPDLRRVVRPLRIDNYLVPQGDTLIALMREPFGLELTFGGLPSMDGSALTTIQLFREREAEASAWRGTLPNGLAFDDSPEIVFRKLKRDPDTKTEDDFAGFALWHFDDYSLQVKYSTMHNWILSVMIYGPGVWEGY